MSEPICSVKIPVGISACLFGEKVRYDGGHKRDAYLTDTLGTYFDYVPVCPEVGCGLPVPRESMHLVGTPAQNRLIGIKSGTDYTDRMQAYCDRTIESLRTRNLHGFIFKAKSPSSGLFRVTLYTPEGMPTPQQVSGLFARAFVRAFPGLPCEEDGRLHDPVLRENFIERVFALKRFRDDVAAAPSVSALQSFHACAKYLLMAHDPDGLHDLGRLAAAATPENLPGTLAAYETRFLSAMGELATTGRHVNALQHMQGYFSDRLTPMEREELADVLDEYARGQVPLIVPVTLFRHYIFNYQVAYLMQQYYLYPHPAELKLRNHA
ncbi:MAG: DUF523 and DUF1722 domain-containing protein [Kiritimatiellae bacterium]|nr:DUF523 and DUF1722 domain-containing protein [Kiritimatiellia bacterium]